MKWVNTHTHTLSIPENHCVPTDKKDLDKPEMSQWCENKTGQTAEVPPIPQGADVGMSHGERLLASC